MEKRRRARINNCLNELKALILDAMKKDVSSTIYVIILTVLIAIQLSLQLKKPGVRSAFEPTTFGPKVEVTPTRQTLAALGS